MSTWGREADAAWRAKRKRQFQSPGDELREQLRVWRYDLEQRLYRAQLRVACAAPDPNFHMLADEVSAFKQCVDLITSGAVEQELAA